MLAQYATRSETERGAADREALADRMHEAGFAGDAAALLAPVVRAHPGRLSARVLLAIALADAGDIAAAIGVLRETVARAPDCAVAWSNLGMLLKIESRFDEAIEAADRAVALQPGHAQIRLNRAIVLLRAGRMDEAWPDYEARLQGGWCPERLLPSLDTLGPGGGRRVLVLHEEGFGDTLQFARYLPMLAARGFHVMACVPPELHDLIARVPGIAEMLPPSAPVPDFDFHCAFFSLPRAFATTLETIPATVPYLTPPPERILACKQRIGDLPGLRVGVVWAGQARPWLRGFQALDARRSLRLDQLAPLGDVGGISFVSLQKGAPADQARTAAANLRLLDVTTGIADFADTAGIIARLDAVVSVDTSVAHLAGAMGKPVLLLDRYDSCWRWFAGRNDSPWYPAMRIFRQPAPGVWDAPLAEAAAWLREAALRRSSEVSGGAPAAPPLCSAPARSG